MSNPAGIPVANGGENNNKNDHHRPFACTAGLLPALL